MEVKYYVYETATGKDVTDERDWYLDIEGNLCYESDDLCCPVRLVSMEEYHYVMKCDYSYAIGDDRTFHSCFKVDSRGGSWTNE